MVCVRNQFVYNAFAFGHDCFVFLFFVEENGDQDVQPEIVLGEAQTDKFFFD